MTTIFRVANIVLGAFTMLYHAYNSQQEIIDKILTESIFAMIFLCSDKNIKCTFEFVNAYCKMEEQSKLYSNVNLADCNLFDLPELS